MQEFAVLTAIVNDRFYTFILIPLLLAVGIYFSVRIKCGQFTHLKHVIKLLSKPAKEVDGEKGISPFKAFTISAASQIGTGNIVGVAAAIAAGGPGAVFWMWVIALIGGASSFVENTIGQIFKVKNYDGTFRGGPAYYMSRALGLPKLGIIFSIIISIVYGFMFNAIQANTIASAFSNTFGVREGAVGIVVAIVAGFIIFGGIRRIADVTSLLVPVMALAYIGVSLFIVITNITMVPAMFKVIFENAFGIRAIGGATLGMAILNGIRRGLFSNEAGMGSVPNASSTADVDHPAEQGLIQALGVYINTIVVCSATAFIILLGGEEIYTNPALQGLQITQNALAVHIGPWAHNFLTVCIFMFAFSSIIGNYYYGESNIENLGFNQKQLIVYRAVVLVMVYLGCVGDFSVVWNTGDIFMGVMAIINLIVLLKLGKISVEAYNDYFLQIREGKKPKFRISNLKSLKGLEDKIECWEK